MKIQVALAKSDHGTAWIVARDKRGRYLIGKRGPTSNNAGQWGFLGGGVDAGEEYAEAAAREGNEEAGIVIESSDLHEATISLDGHSIWFELFKKIDPVPTDEVVQFKWVEPYNMHKYKLHKSVKDYFINLVHGLTV